MYHGMQVDKNSYIEGLDAAAEECESTRRTDELLRGTLEYIVQTISKDRFVVSVKGANKPVTLYDGRNEAAAYRTLAWHIAAEADFKLTIK